jgi:hypothetical protein
MNALDKFSSYRWGEGVTGGGQVVSFTCPPDDVTLVREFLKEHVRSLDILVTGQVNVQHGCYGRYTRYDVVQHKYVGGRHGFLEMIEIRSPPDDRCGFVLYEDQGFYGSFFTEWESVETASVAFEKHWSGGSKLRKQLSAEPGFKRLVECGRLMPWFYAIGDQVLLGDYAFPEGLQDDPVYAFGKRFVVFNQEGYPSIKTCMGTRFINQKENRSDHEPHTCYRLVYWHDGTVWDESYQHRWWMMNDKSNPPRPILDEELWVTEAVEKFYEFISGKTTEFSFNLLNGDKFVGKLAKSKGHKVTSEGSYYVTVHHKGKTEPEKGKVDFKPTAKYPDLISYVTAGLKNRIPDLEIERIDVKCNSVEKGGKKWSGVFFSPPSSTT